MRFISVIAGCMISAAVFMAPLNTAVAYQGLDLGRDCRSSTDAGLARCEGFIRGFIAGAQMDIEGEPINMWRAYGNTWCGPIVFEVSDVVDALFAASRAGEATPHFPAAVMLAQSLAMTYPCTESPTPGFPRPSLRSVIPDQ